LRRAIAGGLLGAALGALCPIVWYYGREHSAFDTMMLEKAGPPGIGTILLWAGVCGLSLAISFAFPEDSNP
jgi:hypothetical protein